jgi:hypothetical protein
MTHTTNTPLTPADIGLDCAIHDPALDRFPWQLALADGRVVLLSADLARSAILPTGGDIREPNCRNEVPGPLVPAEVLTAAKLALSQADGDGLAAILRRRRQIAQIWGVDDVAIVRPDLTDDQAWEVLLEIEATMDADTGITWRVLQDAAEELFGPAPDGAGG